MKVIDRVCNAPKIQQKTGFRLFFLSVRGWREKPPMHATSIARLRGLISQLTRPAHSSHFTISPSTFSCDTFLQPTFKVICKRVKDVAAGLGLTQEELRPICDLG